MQPFQERVITEKQELDIKIEALTDFLNKDVPMDEAEKLRLKSQLVAMELYSGILGFRIKNFK